jgi:cation diffusion facilitator CzcD-associated flavoprotein CzcO
MPTCDVAIVGAGPYGLSAAAHLKAANGLDIRVFGEPMSFWERHMPHGMLLRSPLAGSHLSDPEGALNLQAFQTATGRQVSAPLPLGRFTEYGRWFQGNVVPDVERRTVARVEKLGAHFRLSLDEGEDWQARRVVVAAGITPFAWRPSQFKPLPGALVSHTCGHRDLSPFAGKKMIVVGGGQSALESAALLHELGSDVEVLIRAPLVRWLWRRPWVHSFPPVARMLYAPPDVGQAGISHLVARPSLFRQLPRLLQDYLAKRAIRPAGAAWLKPRCRDIPISTGRTVISTAVEGDQAVLRLDDGSLRRADHILLATGYRVDISRYPFLGQDLLTQIGRAQGYPRLDAGFESSVPGLHFLGAPAAWSFGPLMRFVAGAEFASRALTRGIHGKSPAHRS